MGNYNIILQIWGPLISIYLPPGYVYSIQLALNLYELIVMIRHNDWYHLITQSLQTEWHLDPRWGPYTPVDK